MVTTRGVWLHMAWNIFGSWQGLTKKANRQTTGPFSGGYRHIVTSVYGDSSAVVTIFPCTSAAMSCGTLHDTSIMSRFDAGLRMQRVKTAKMTTA